MNDRDLEGLVNELRDGRVSRRQFMEKALVMGLTVSGVAAVLAACGQSGTSANTSAGASPSLPPMGEATDTLHLYNWSDYMDPATKKKFTKKTGIKVVETYFDDNEALRAKLQAGARGYDVIVPSDYMVHILLKSKLVEPLDMSAIPNFANVGEKFVKPVYDNPDENGGLKYSVPYQWGQTGVSQHLDKIPTQITKWADLWNPAFKDEIYMLNDERETMGVGLMKVTGDPKSINTTDQATIDKAVQELIAQKPLLRGYDSVNMKRNIVAGTPLVHCWNGDIILALNAGVPPKDLVLVACEEGIPLFVDNLAIPVGAPNRKGAHMFLDFILDVKVGASNTAWVGYYSPLPDSVPLVNEIDPNVMRYVPDQQMIDAKGEFYQDMGALASMYTTAWQTVKSA
jgi:spermidine/putrescine transport system substrate-binding protein